MIPEFIDRKGWQELLIMAIFAWLSIAIFQYSVEEHAVKGIGKDYDHNPFVQGNRGSYTGSNKKTIARFKHKTPILPVESFNTFFQDTSYYPLIDSAMHLVHVEAHFEAIDLFSRLIQQFPNHPMGYFYRAATFHTLMRDYRTRQFESKFQADLDSAIQIGERLKDIYPNDEWIYFYLGGAYGFRGLHKVRQGEWLGAFRDAWRGVQNLKKAYQLNPQNYDVLFGLGTYHYWRSAKAKILRFLPFFGDQRQQGIDELWLAAQKGRFTRIEALYALQVVYFDFQKYYEAWQVNQALYKQFSSNPVCLYFQARILEKMEQYQEALKSYQRLLDHLQQMPYTQCGYFMEVHYRIASITFRLGWKIKCKKHLNKAFMFLQRRKSGTELEGPLESYKEIIEGMYNLQHLLAEA